MITDPSTGNQVRHIPVSLMEGQESTPVTLRIAPEIENAKLQAGSSAAAKIMGRIAPGSFQELAVSPLDLPAMGLTADVELKVIAADSLPGVTRVILSAFIPKRIPAAWRG